MATIPFTYTWAVSNAVASSTYFFSPPSEGQSTAGTVISYSSGAFYSAVTLDIERVKGIAGINSAAVPSASYTVVVEQAISPTTSNTNSNSQTITKTTSPGTSPTTISTPTTSSDSSSSSGSSSPAPTSTATAGSGSEQTSSPKQSPVSERKAHVSTGAAAGIGVGCAIAGALIVGLIAFLLLKKQKRKGSAYPSRPRSSDGYHDHESKGVGISAIPLNTSSLGSDIDAAIPPPMPEREVEGEVSKLGTLIKNHAQSYYAGGAPIMQPVLDAGLAAKQMTMLLGPNAPVAAAGLVSLLSDPLSRVAATRFILAWAILRNVQFDAHAETTLLPPDLAESIHHMTLANASNNDALRRPLMNKWRQLSGVLLQAKYGDGTLMANDPRQQNIEDLANMLNNILAPYATGNWQLDAVEGERARNLGALVKRGARFGYLIFTQPSTWEFGWSNGSGGIGNELVVFPALIQTGDEHGRLLSRSRAWSQTQSLTW
ncbi:hypothetical protein K431DRAFT_287568 [Polychaeton citri CBS 116435]|uniref:Uncharacterized protein n=1 Tax=Polychaeton citri CBS 116435 TaxID=1314669 RepID=A0A9P4Q0X0_9PEZI|nr:hypothetical protein K431DRAFT_287568 [Polychaeton citri CBS 116435]